MKREFSILAMFVLILGCASIASAQAPLVTDTLQVYAPGVDPVTGAPTQITVIPETAFVCNQAAPSLPSQVVNPTRVVKDDPAHVGQVCIASTAGTFLLALPNTPGNWTATMTVTDNLGQTSPKSAASNSFLRDSAAAPTGVRVQ